MIDNIGEYFTDALAESGFPNATVQTAHDAASMSTTVKVSAEINGEMRHYKQHIQSHEISQVSDPKQYIANVANQVARSFEQATVEHAIWADSHVLFDEKNDVSAKCLRCNTTVTLDDIPESGFKFAETATPNPPVDVESVLTPHKREMVLLALLREKCDPMCENSDDRKI